MKVEGDQDVRLIHRKSGCQLYPTEVSRGARALDMKPCFHRVTSYIQYINQYQIIHLALVEARFATGKACLLRHNPLN